MSDAVNETMNDAPLPAPMRGGMAALMWAVFLGCSWTWVIGMYFPVLLVRDYGLWGWIVFAVPNVLGAAAMGFVLKDPEASRRLVEKHLTACRWFGLVTVAYQAYLVGAFAGPVGLVIAGLVAVGILLLGKTHTIRDTFSAAIVFAISLGLFAYAQSTGNLWKDLSAVEFTGRLTPMHLLMFVPAAVFGFALCPYLDLTFHRARQATDAKTGRIAFAVGFGIFFFSMIIFSLAYAGAFENVTAIKGIEYAPKLWPVLLSQLVVQGGFTAAVHLRSLRSPENRRAEFGLFVAVFLGLILGLGALLMDREPGPWRDWTFVTSVTELGYRGFLLLYGTVFPAYVLICMTPTYRQVSHKSRILLFAIVAALSYPLACTAFIANRAGWVLLILVIIVIGRVVVEWLPKKQDL